MKLLREIDCMVQPMMAAQPVARNQWCVLNGMQFLMSLELRPTCEHCNKPLPPDSTEAMICSFECTFCSACVDKVLANVCPNCGGGFERRPIRPATEHKRRANTMHHPPTAVITHRPVDVDRHVIFASSLVGIDPSQR